LIYFWPVGLYRPSGIVFYSNIFIFLGVGLTNNQDQGGV